MSQGADIERALAAGFDHHLLKPIPIEELQRLIGRARPLAADEAEE